MKRRYMRGIINPTGLVATALIGIATILGFVVIPAIPDPLADMYIEPAEKAVPVGETFTVELMVRSSVPTNVFAGELLFDNEILEVVSIDYNTSIADLWAKRPWYSNGAGTLNFAGGTTRPGGFVGNDALLTITFESRAPGEGALEIHDQHILRHDGQGTELELPDPLEAVFTVKEESSTLDDIATKERVEAPVKVVERAPTTDLNGDGKQTVADISIFMLHLVGDDPEYDFNLDGKVNTKDLSIIMNAD